MKKNILKIESFLSTIDSNYYISYSEDENGECYFIRVDSFEDKSRVVKFLKELGVFFVHDMEEDMEHTDGNYYINFRGM